MGSKKGPTLRAQWLGKQLREFREASRLTLKEAGDYIQRDAAALSRLENGLVPARVPDVLMLLNLYGVSEHRIRDGLERLSRDIWQKGWWDGYATETTGRIIDLAWLESRADEVHSYTVTSLHGLLQTEDYAREIMTPTKPDAPVSYFARWVKFRMLRQTILRGDEPPLLSFIVDEAALRRIVGGREVMRAQLTHLVELGSHPTLIIRVLSFEAGAHASPEGGFSIYQMPDPYPDVAHIESRAGALYVEAEGVEPFQAAYDCLVDTALSPDESTAFIDEIARTL